MARGRRVRVTNMTKTLKQLIAESNAREASLYAQVKEQLGFDPLKRFNRVCLDANNVANVSNARIVEVSGKTVVVFDCEFKQAYLSLGGSGVRMTKGRTIKGHVVLRPSGWALFGKGKFWRDRGARHGKKRYALALHWLIRCAPEKGEFAVPAEGQWLRVPVTGEEQIYRATKPTDGRPIRTI